MPERTMLRIGDFDFEISTAAYQKYVGSRGSRWPEQERLQNIAALQYVGPNTPDITLDGVIYTGAIGVKTDALTQLRNLSFAKKPHLMITGTGTVGGYWAVMDVSDTRSYFTDDGRARKIEFSVKCRYYGPYYNGQRGGPAKSGVPSVLVPNTGNMGLPAAIETLPSINSLSTLAEISQMAFVVRDVARDAISLATDMIRVLTDPTYAAMTAFSLLPHEALLAVRDVRQAAYALASIGDYVDESISAITALPYTFSGTSADRTQYRINAVSNSLFSGVHYMQATAQTHAYTSQAAHNSFTRNARTYQQLEDRNSVMELCDTEARHAASVNVLCSTTALHCTQLLEKFHE